MELVLMELSDADVEKLKAVSEGNPIDAADFDWLVKCGVLEGTPLRPCVNETGKAFLS